MTKIKWGFPLFILVFILLFLYFHKVTTPKESILVDSVSKVEVRKRFDKQGKLKADVEIIDGVRQGVAHNYYSSGIVHSEIYYNEDIKHGVSTWFYENGNPYRVTNFVDGKKQGLKKKYYKSGKLMAEIPYVNGNVQLGTTEYWEMGKKVKHYPELEFSNDNNIYSVWLNPRIKKAKFYVLVKTALGDKRLNPMQIDKKAIFDIRKHAQDEAYVYVEYKTNMGNLKLMNKKLQ